MKNVNILTNKFNSPNGIAFLFPLIHFRKKFFESGIKLNFFTNIKDKRLLDCDYFIIDYRFLYGQFNKNFDILLDFLKNNKQNSDKIIFYDNTDSTGTLSDQVLDHVDIYLKNQILKDSSLYLKKYYGARIYTDFYNKRYEVTDKQNFYQKPITVKNIKKIRVGWNSGLCEYSVFSAYKQSLIKNFSLPETLNFFKFVTNITKPSNERLNLVSCRIGSDYPRPTVAYQRQQINKLLKGLKKTKKVSRLQYFRELKNSRVVVSPFGWGEISLRDFEVFLTGGLLYKPKMNHLKTWPDFFEEDVTIKCFDWDLKNFERNLEEIISNFSNYLSIALNAQERYLKYTSDEGSFDLFLKHFKSTLA